MPRRASTAEIDARLEYAEKVGYDIHRCAHAWSISASAVYVFLWRYKLGRKAAVSDMEPEVSVPDRDKPEYENQPLFDLQALTREEYMKKYRLPSKSSYHSLLGRMEKKHGFIATPERRQKWIEEDERKEFAEDHTAAECGKEWGLSGKVAGAWCRKHGVKPKSRRLPPDLPERMIGMTVAEAKAAFFPDSTGVYVFMHKNGLYVRGKNREIYRK